MKSTHGLLLATPFVALVGTVLTVALASDRVPRCSGCGATSVPSLPPACPTAERLRGNRPRRVRQSARAASAAEVLPTVRMVYLVPSDRTARTDYAQAIENAARHLQAWYRDELGTGKTFLLSSPVVDVLATPHPAGWYASHPAGAPADEDLWYFWNVTNDGFSLTDGDYYDPNYIWIYYIDADPACGQLGGAGGSGVAVLPANDLRGLVGKQTTAACPTEPPDTSPPCRWVGGLGHEVGHALGLPHPTACDDGNPATTCPDQTLMWLGFASYPETYLLTEDKVLLNASPYIVMFNPGTVSINCNQLIDAEPRCPLEDLLQQARHYLPRSSAMRFPSASTLSVLRGLRDEVLARSPEGRALIQSYYAQAEEIQAWLWSKPRAASEMLRFAGQLSEELHAQDCRSSELRLSVELFEAGRQLLDSARRSSSSPELLQACNTLEVFIDHRTKSIEGMVLFYPDGNHRK